MTELPPPVIVLAPPRSFSSIVTAMLGQHPDAYGLPEVNLFVGDTVDELFEHYAEFGERNERRQDGLVRTIAELFSGKQNEGSAFIAKRWLKQNGHQTTTFVFAKLRERVAPRVVVEKSITTVWNGQNLKRALAIHPKARYIHLTRHPRSHGESIFRLASDRNWQVARGVKDYSTDPPTFDPQLLWYRAHERIQRHLADIPPERRLLVRGEDVLQDPDRQLLRIAAWMGLRTDGEAIEEMKHPERSPFAKMGPDNAPFGADHEFLTNPKLRPTKAREESLDGPLSWRQDVEGFRTPVRELATEFGYH